MPSDDAVWRERGLRDAILRGDERAWQTLYDESFAGLEAYVSWRCAGLRHLAEEVIQETWLTAVRRIGRFDPDQGSFLNWLRGIAANLLRNRLRRKTAPRRPEGTTPDAAHELEQREQAEGIARALAELPDHYEAVLRAKYLEQLSVEEIAASMNQTPKAVESLLTRARAAFRIVYPIEEAAPREAT